MDDAEFLRQFEACTLPFDQWTHRAHVKVAYLYIRLHGLEDAITRLRAGIRAYNAKNNVPDSSTSGYNETTTCAFSHLIAAMISAYSGTFPVAAADEFCDAHPQLMSRHILRLFYSPGQRMHPDAQQKFIEPDLAPLPRIIG